MKQSDMIRSDATPVYIEKYFFLNWPRDKEVLLMVICLIKSSAVMLMTPINPIKFCTLNPVEYSRFRLNRFQLYTEKSTL